MLCFDGPSRHSVKCCPTVVVTPIDYIAKTSILGLCLLLNRGVPYWAGFCKDGCLSMFCNIFGVIFLICGFNSFGAGCNSVKISNSSQLFR